jgi:hypothetical protein
MKGGGERLLDGINERQTEFTEIGKGKKKGKEDTAAALYIY